MTKKRPLWLWPIESPLPLYRIFGRIFFHRHGLGAGQTVQYAEDRIPHLGKTGHVLGADRFLGLRFDGQRVDGFSVFVHAEVQVRTGGQSGGAHVADHFLLFDARSYLDPLGKAREVHVGRSIDAVVSYLQVIASAVGLIPFGDDLAAADGIDRCAGRSGVVHSVVRTVTFQYRMVTAVGKAG